MRHSRKPSKELAAVLDEGAPGFLRAVRESGMELLTITLDHIATAALLPPVHRDAFEFETAFFHHQG